MTQVTFSELGSDRLALATMNLSAEEIDQTAGSNVWFWAGSRESGTQEARSPARPASAKICFPDTFQVALAIVGIPSEVVSRSSLIVSLARSAALAGNAPNINKAAKKTAGVSGRARCRTEPAFEHPESRKHLGPTLALFTICLPIPVGTGFTRLQHARSADQQEQVPVPWSVYAGPGPPGNIKAC